MRAGRSLYASGGPFAALLWSVVWGMLLSSSVAVPMAYGQTEPAPWHRLQRQRWAIVVSSNAEHEHAEAAARTFRSRLPDQRVDVLITTASRRLPYRVAIGPFASLDEARETRAGLRGLPSDAWIWEVPPNVVALDRTVALRPATALAALPYDPPQEETSISQKSEPTVDHSTARPPRPESAEIVDVQATSASPKLTDTATDTSPSPASRRANPTSSTAGRAQSSKADDTRAGTLQRDTMQAAKPKPVQRRGRRFVAARPLRQPIQIDGVLSETAWKKPGKKGFIQRSPKIGSPPSEDTEVWVAFDEEALYVAARCYDRDPSRIALTIGPRDSQLEADWFSVYIDPHRDHRTGYFFQVSSGGSIRDGTIFDEIRTDDSWDGIWEHGTAVDSLGWSAELRIPFAHLRFDAEQETWGINFARYVQRISEETALIPGRKVRVFAELSGLQDIPSPVQLDVYPYIAAQAESYEKDASNPFFPGQEFGSRVGGDVRFRINPSLTANGTINPDFGQVEVDPAVINLTAQETLYEEKRPFFLEDAHLFDFFRDREMRFFHSRRIGESPVGEPIHQGYNRIPEETRIIGAAKLSGKINGSWNIGWLNALTAREYARIDSVGVRFQDEVAPLASYHIVRARRETLQGRQGIGFFASGVVRDLRADHLKPILNDKAFVGGIDGWRFFGKRRWWLLEGWVSTSYISGDSLRILYHQRAPQRYYQRPDATHLHEDSSATSLSGSAGELKFGRVGGKLQVRSSLKFVSPGFDLNDLGYLRYADQIIGDLTFLFVQGRPSGMFNKKIAGVTLSRVYDFSRTRLSTSYTLFARLWFSNLWEGRLNISYTPEGLDVRMTRGGPSMLAPTGWSSSASLSTDSSKPVLFFLSGETSQDNGGNWSYGLGSNLTWRPSNQLALSLAPWWSTSLWKAGFVWKRNDPWAVDTYGRRTVFADLRQDYFSTDLRLNWTFTPKLSLQTFFQLYYAHVRYEGFKELSQPASYTFNVYGEGASIISERDEYGGYTIDPDGEGTAKSFTIYEPNFDFASLRGTTVLRWDYRQRSSIYLAWTHDRYTYEDFWQQPDGGLLSASPFNQFVFKLTYWLQP